MTKPDTPVKEKIKEIDLSGFAHKQMIRYATSVNEDRAVSEYHDGCKPVQRRVLWAAYTGGYRHGKAVEKSARLVGDTLGKFHPHGDLACYGAIVNMVTARYALLDGEGNFGSFANPKGFAAPRYTNVRLSKFSELVFFDPFYLPLTRFVSNYDSKDREPLYLHSLLPNILFNTTFAIGVGLTAKIPKFTMESVVNTLIPVLRGTPATAESCAASLVFCTQFGGVLAPKQGKLVRELFTTGKATLVYDSPYRINVKDKSITFTGFAPFSNFDARAEKLAADPDVQSTSDTSSRGQRIGEFTAYLRPRVDVKNVSEVAARLAAKLRESELYFVNVTIRTANSEVPDEPSIALRSTTVPELLNKWAAYRVKLEVSACAYQIDIKDKEIRRVTVLRIAVANRATIIRALDKKLDDEQLAAYLAKALKVTVDEAKSILELRVRQLKALEDDKLVAELKKLKALRAEYEQRKAKPNAYVVRHLQTLLKELS